MAEKSMKGNILTKRGYRNTKSRQAVLEILEKTEVPLSAEDIFLCIKQSGRSVNLSTVYRILELMESMQLVEKTVINDGRARFTLMENGHTHHLICTRCHRMVSIDSCPLKALESDISRETQFDITGHKLEVYGLCPDCRKD